MTIYDTQVLSERTIKNFKPTRLYIRELCGMYYFGKSSSRDINWYYGSGTVWTKRIQKYGKENIRTLWISDWYYCPHEIQEVALHFSKENKIVESKLWANLRPENGLDGGDLSLFRSEKAKITRAKQIGVNAANYDNTVYTFMHKTGIIEITTRMTLINKYNVSPSNLSSVISGHRSTVNGWKLLIIPE